MHWGFFKIKAYFESVRIRLCMLVISIAEVTFKIQGRAVCKFKKLGPALKTRRNARIRKNNSITGNHRNLPLYLPKVQHFYGILDIFNFSGYSYVQSNRKKSCQYRDFRDGTGLKWKKALVILLTIGVLSNF